MKMKKVRLASFMMLLQAAVIFPTVAHGMGASHRSHQQIQGTVDFVQRKGILPGTMEPMTYWSVVVHGKGVDYELSHVFGMDYGARPQSTSIEGQIIRPGDQV